MWSLPYEERKQFIELDQRLSKLKFAQNALKSHRSLHSSMLTDFENFDDFIDEEEEYGKHKFSIKCLNFHMMI